MYRYDLHVHTSEVSPCAHLNVKEMVRRYEAAGYQGIWLIPTGGSASHRPDHKQNAASLKKFQRCGCCCLGFLF